VSSYNKMPSDHQSTALSWPSPKLQSVNTFHKPQTSCMNLERFQGQDIPASHKKYGPCLLPPSLWQGRNQSGRHVLATVSAAAPISLTVIVEQDIFRLQIAVNDTQRMQVSEGQSNLCDVESSNFLAEPALALQMEEQLSSLNTIHNVPLFSQTWK